MLDDSSTAKWQILAPCFSVRLFLKTESSFEVNI